MLYNDAYATLFGSLSINNDTHEYLDRILITDDYRKRNVSITTGLNIYYVSPFTTKELNDLPVFKHPAFINDKGNTVIATDIRPYLNEKSTIREDKYVTSNPTELNFAFLRTLLNAYFVTELKEYSYRYSYANTVYAAWISDTVSKRYGLDPEDQLKVFVAAYYFYMSLLQENPLTEQEVILKSKAVVDASRSTASFVLDTAEKLEPTSGLNDLIKNIQNVTKNKRLDDLNVGTLATIVGSTWYGTFSKDIIAVGLEHVPTFTAIVGISATQRYYKKSMIAQIAEVYGKHNKLESFIENINHLFRANKTTYE
jgi:hypothetical protein